VPLVHSERIEAGIGFDWSTVPKVVTTLEGVPDDAQELHFLRERKSHRGFARLQRLKRAWLNGIDAEFLAEIAQVPSLEVLQLSRVTAADLGPLHRLRRLKRLMVGDAGKIESLHWVAGLPELDALQISNFKRVRDLEPLTALQSLVTLGVEGGMWSPMRPDTLAPLARMPNLRNLFLLSTRVADRSLRPLHALKDLRVLQCTTFYPDDEFRELRRALPKLECSWFELLDRYGNLRDAVRAIVGQIPGHWPQASEP
jgi:hypothetical protein